MRDTKNTKNIKNTKNQLMGLASVMVCLGLASSCKSTTIEFKELTIFHTNDLHLHFHPPKSDAFGLGGMAKLATVLNERRTKVGSSMTLDAGDWGESSWYYNTELGAGILKMMDHLNYDAVVMGNHDYLSGPDHMIELIKTTHPKFAAIAGNFDFNGYVNAAEFQKTILPYTIVEKDGLKIGVIGLTTVDYVFSFWLDPVKVRDPIQSAREMAAILRPQVDVLLVLSHNSFSLNQQLARSVLGIDAVISGHSHKKVPTAVMVNNAGRQVPVVETGSWGRFIGELKLKYSAKYKMVKFDSYHLNPVSEDTVEDPIVAQMVKDEDDKLAAKYGVNPHEEVASSEIDLHPSGGHEAGIGNLVTKAYRKATGADVAFEVAALTAVPVMAGMVSRFDLHDAVPHIYNKTADRQWTIKLLEMRGSDLILILNLIHLNELLPWIPSLGIAHDNIELTVVPKSANVPIGSLKDIRVGGVHLDHTKTYTVAVTDGTLLSFTEANRIAHLGMDLTHVLDTQIENATAVTDYAIAESVLTVEGLKAGSHRYWAEADLAMYNYDIHYFEGIGLSVVIRNEGLKPAVPFKVVCTQGVPDDIIFYGTDDEKPYTPIGEAVVDYAIQPGEVGVVDIAWSPTGGRRFPVSCGLRPVSDSSFDSLRVDDGLGFSGNNGGSRVFDTGVPQHYYGKGLIRH